MKYVAGNLATGKVNGAGSRARIAHTLAACALLLLAGSAFADPPQAPQPRRDMRDMREMRREMRDSRWERHANERADEQRRMMEENSNNAEFSRRVGRMTADERRDLRRQINEAGQEVYALPPKR